MAYDLSNCLVVGISSRALFDLERENQIFERDGVEAYCAYQREHEKEILPPGSGFQLIKALLNINTFFPESRRVEIIIMSHNSPDTSLRIFHSISHYGLDISRAALTSGAHLAPYLEAFKTDLFLSADEQDVQQAIDSNIAAGLICTHSNYSVDLTQDISQIRIAFDGDAVLFSDDSEKIYQSQGLEAFAAHEAKNAQSPLPEGPFAKLLKTLSMLQQSFPKDSVPIRTALVTARNAPAHERVIRTFRSWDVRVDEAFFLGGVEKSAVLKAFGAHIFFDDQPTHIDRASQVVPSARVPYKSPG